MSPPLVGDQSPAREPAFNAPWQVLALVALLIGAHAVRVLAGIDVGRFALTAGDLRAGRWIGLIGYLFVHANWAHVLINAAFTLAFGAPVARFLGGGARGAATFFGFFVICGVLAALGYSGLFVAVGGAGDWALVGASGAASGLLGAAARLIEGRGRLGPISGRTVVGMSLAWVGVNTVLGLSGLTPGAAGLPVAWEAHVFGYFVGLILIGPAAGLASGSAPDRALTP